MKRTLIVAGVAGLLLVTPVIYTQTRHEIAPEPVSKQATWKQKQRNRAMAKLYARAGWGWQGKQWHCLNTLLTNESRFDHLAVNQKGSSAYGIGQLLNETSSDPAIQLLHTFRYIQRRYYTPCNALAFHNRKNWY